jgi:hypothetical protein
VEVAGGQRESWIKAREGDGVLAAPAGSRRVRGVVSLGWLENRQKEAGGALHADTPAAPLHPGVCINDIIFL